MDSMPGLFLCPDGLLSASTGHVSQVCTPSDQASRDGLATVGDGLRYETRCAAYATGVLVGVFVGART